jgi:hypothetical protein
VLIGISYGQRWFVETIYALMLLDSSQYDLCNSIKNMKDKDSQE